MNPDDIEILEVYNRKDGHRDWAHHSDVWLHPGDMICLISGDTAKEIKELFKIKAEDTPS